VICELRTVIRITHHSPTDKEVMMGKNTKILVVDDESFMRDMLRDILEKEGYEVALAPGGEEALGVLVEQKYDIVLSDLKMPRMDGISLLKKVKQRYPDTAVVVMTGYSDAYSMKDACVSGADEYITKPFKINEISLIMERVRWRMLSLRNRKQVEKHLGT